MAVPLYLDSTYYPPHNPVTLGGGPVPGGPGCGARGLLGGQRGLYCPIGDVLVDAGAQNGSDVSPYRRDAVQLLSL